MDLGSYIMSAHSSARSCCSLLTDWRAFTSDPAALMDLARSGGVFYLLSWFSTVVVALLFVHARLVCRCGRPVTLFALGIALVPCRRSLGMFSLRDAVAARLRMWRERSRSPIRWQASSVAHASERAALHPAQLCEVAAEFLVLVAFLLTENRSEVVSRPDVLAVCCSTRSPLRHRVLSR